MCVDGEDKSLVRIHQMLVFPDEMDESCDGKVKSFINEVTTTEKVYYNELVYYLENLLV